MSKKRRYIDSWARESIEYKDQKHDHGTEEVPRHRGKKKDTKRWCKGKVGREHDWDVTEPVKLRWTNMTVTKMCCKNCGKKDSKYEDL